MADERAQAEAQAEQANETHRGESEGTSSGQRSAAELRRELLEVIGELRAEVARLQVDEMRSRLRQWVRENPTLAVFLATGTGILAGRLLTKAFTPSPPPPLSERARQRARILTAETQRRAADVGKDVAKRASEAGRQADRVRRQAQQQAAKTGEQLSRQARDWGAVVAERASTLGEDASERARSLGKAIDKGVGKDISNRAGKAFTASKQGVSDTTDTVRTGYKAARFGWKAAQWAFTLMMARRSMKWLRKIF